MPKTSEILSALWTAWLVVIGGLGLLMAILRTNPEEISSNLSKWLEWAGVRRIPAKLRAKAVDRTVSRWAARTMALLLLGGLVGFYQIHHAPAWLSFTSDAPPSIPQAASQSVAPPPVSENPSREEYARQSVAYYLDALHRLNAIQAHNLISPDVGKRLVVSGRLTASAFSPSLITIGLGLVPNLVNCQFDASFSNALSGYNTGDEIKVDGVISDQNNANGMILRYCKLSS